MAKTALVAGEQSGNAKPNQLAERVTGYYDQARNFLTDVRAEMRKVVVPNRKEVQATTTVVLVTVFVFALYFWVVDTVFNYGLTKLMDKLVGS
ncbi:preprotein translocase subunit SecE [Acidicapsa dinghuensis]|uniref:Protein translocase subunit SecE n=1 Tax=Acidicapsa dinghuensis TaxID=2218256 RepID=A0ABW1ECY3_9BACT|nr:preprotein translocase subunit SecE [Acidicapsa dinghuensis]